MEAAGLPKPALPVRGLKEREELNPFVLKAVGRYSTLAPHFLLPAWVLGREEAETPVS